MSRLTWLTLFAVAALFAAGTTASAQSIDLNSDGVRDILLQDKTTGDVAAWLMNPAGEPVEFVGVSYAGEGFRDVAVPQRNYACSGGACAYVEGGYVDHGPWTIVGDRDLNLDGIGDILLQSTSYGSVIGWVMNGAGKPASVVFVEWARTRFCQIGLESGFPYCITAPEYRVVATPDLDGDGTSELVWQAPPSTVISVYNENVWTYLTSQPSVRIDISSTTSGWRVAGSADVNRDGVPDLLLQHLDESVGAWLMGVDGHAFEFVSISGPTSGWQVVGATDLNDDGEDDILLQHEGGAVGGWILGPDGHVSSFEIVWAQETGGLRVNGVLVLPPTIVAMPKVTTPRNTPVAVTVTLGGGAGGATALGLTAASSNQTLVPNANLAITGSGANRTLTITPAANRAGSTTITVTASDGATNASTSFLVRVPGVRGDFDGDGRTEIGVFRPSTGTWYILESGSGAGAFTVLGQSFGIPAIGDYDGDGKTDHAVFEPLQTPCCRGSWRVKGSATGGTFGTSMGEPGEVSVPGDYDGDALADYAMYRPSTGLWTVEKGSSDVTYQWGLTGDVPVPADYDGDGKTDVAVWRPLTGIWYIRNSSDGSQAFLQWGLTGDLPVAGDYDGDGKADAAVFRPSTGIWYVRDLATNTPSFYQWGLAGDMPVSGDFDGDGKTDVAVFRPSTNVWYIRNSSDGAGTFYQWGLDGDIPVLKGPN